MNLILQCLNNATFCLFDSLHPSQQSFSYVGTGLSGSNQYKMKKVNKQCLLDTPRTVTVSEKTWQVIVRTRIP